MPRSRKKGWAEGKSGSPYLKRVEEKKKTRAGMGNRCSGTSPSQLPASQKALHCASDGTKGQRVVALNIPGVLMPRERCWAMAKRGWEWAAARSGWSEGMPGERPGEQSCNQGGAGGKGRNPRAPARVRGAGRACPTPAASDHVFRATARQHRQCWGSL